jgi:hypothetical protein
MEKIQDERGSLGTQQRYRWRCVQIGDQLVQVHGHYVPASKPKRVGWLFLELISPRINNNQPRVASLP